MSKDFRFVVNPNRFINLNRIDEIDLSSVSNTTFKDILPLYEDLAFSDVSKDTEVSARDEGMQLHRMSQYAMQYIMNSINLLKKNKKRLEDDLQELKSNEDKVIDILGQQQHKIDESKKKIGRVEDEINEEKQLMELQKHTYEENEEMVKSLRAELKKGHTTMSDNLPEVKEFRRIMATSP